MWRRCFVQLSTLGLTFVSVVVASQPQVPSCCEKNGSVCCEHVPLQQCCTGQNASCCGLQKFSGRLSLQDLSHFFDWDFDWDIDGDWITVCAIGLAMLLSAVLYWCCQRRRSTWSSHLRKHHYLATYQYGTFVNLNKA